MRRMKKPKTTRKKSTPLSLSALEKVAFPKHPISLRELREAAYAQKTGETVSERVTAHISGCAACEEHLARIRRTDPILTGDDKSVKVLVDAITSSEVAQRVQEQAQDALEQIVREDEVLVAAAQVVATLIPVEQEEEETKVSQAASG